MKPAVPEQRPHGFFLILLAGCVSVLFPVLEGFVRYREFEADTRDAWFSGSMALVFFVMLYAPILLAILFMIRNKIIRSLFRTLIVMAPVLVLTVPQLVDALIHPEDSQKCFASQMSQTLPSDVSGLKASRSHAAGDSLYMFSFHTTAGSTDALLASRSYQLVKDSSMLDPERGDLHQLPMGGVVPPDGWPKPQTWQGLKVYQWRENNDFCYLLTDGTRTQVFILVGNS